MGKRIYKILRYVLYSLIDIIYPKDRVCFICESYIEEAFPICVSCRGYLPYLDSSVLDYRNTRLENVYSIFSFEGRIKDIIYGLKYNKEVNNANIIGDIMADFIEKEALEVDLIIPIPMHSLRLQERGYNQAELIARRIGKVTGIKVDTSLKKIKNTSSQVLLNGSERWYNVKGSFEADNAYSSKNILLVDDIVTTCATGHFSALELGENNISLLTFASSKKF